MNEWVKATIVAVGILGVASLGAFVGVIATGVNVRVHIT